MIYEKQDSREFYSESNDISNWSSEDLKLAFGDETDDSDLKFDYISNKTVDNTDDLPWKW